jgi:(p)ppGpp synthase/HD superfamily hydrolase
VAQALERDAEALWKALEPKLSYLSNQELALVEEAFAFAHAAHQGQLRRSGEPYITHPVAVAGILAELGMDSETLAAGLLHDTVETRKTEKTTKKEGKTNIKHKEIEQNQNIKRNKKSSKIKNIK